MRHLLPLLLLAGLAVAEDHNLVVTVPGVVPGGHDLELELAWRSEAFLPRAWVMQRPSHGVAAATVTAQQATADGATVDLAVTSARDPWCAAWTAELKLALTQAGGQATGVVTTGEAMTTVDVAVATTRAPVWPRPVGGAASGHPRLLLRAGDLPSLKERLATPAGATMLTRLRQAAAVRFDHNVQDDGQDPKQADAGHAAKFRSWPAIACGVLHHLTGEAQWADKAKAIVAVALADDGGFGIHMAPRLTGIALAYDLCADVWDADFRARVAVDLRRRIGQLDLQTGPNPKAMNLSDLSNHNGIRLGSLGVAALALLGDGPDPALEDLVVHVQRRIRLHFEAGYGDWGFFSEGRFYKGMTLERGLGPFLWANRQALGSRVDPPSADRYLLGDEVLAATPGDVTVQQREKDGGHLATAVALALGAATVPANERGVLRWLMDRSLEGDLPPITAETREGEVLAAAWLPIAYPWEAEAVSPAAAMPSVSCDRRFGRFVVRPAYDSAIDPLLVLNTRCGFAPGGHDKLGWHAGLEIYATGGPLVDGTWLPTVVALPGARNAVLGGVVTAITEDADRRLSVEINLERAYYQGYKDISRAAQDAGRAKSALADLPKDAKPDGREAMERLCAAMGAVRVVEIPKRGCWIDWGVRAQRAIAVDASGEGGLPLLVAIRDRVRIEGGDAAPALTLAVPLPQRDLVLAATGTAFTIIAAPIVLAGTTIGPQAMVTAESKTTNQGGMVNGKFTIVTETTRTLTLSATGELLTILALGNEAAPVIAVDGDRVTVGGRSLMVDGDRLAWR